ncbi:hypothetical protein K2173_010748 [Erythroxylum novogranatense]|uniref:ubiquitinyl hydrolase 1 n=1 Tax=Erythroxylum novogranatense TaxID=1862640 RepID=A0AAV8SQU1_9ROSI|nr:hypothetical protein K2173_010748 [Erythroxylum novogranatense]
MLEPREADLPVLLLVLVVLPVVAYILLGKWSDTARKRDRVSLLAQLACEETLRAEVMSNPSASPLVPASKNGAHSCARCCSPATTRCSRCKTVRYCSGKCQIIHWRQVHRHECQQLETTNYSSSPSIGSVEDFIPERVPISDGLKSIYFGCYNHDASIVTTSSSVDKLGAMLQKRSTDKWASCNSSKEVLRREDMAIINPREESSEIRFNNSILVNNISGLSLSGHETVSSVTETRYKRQQFAMLESRNKYEFSGVLHSGNEETNEPEFEMNYVTHGGNLPTVEQTINGEVEMQHCREMTAKKGNEKAKSAVESTRKGNEKAKSAVESTRNSNFSRSISRQSSQREDRKKQIAHTSRSNGVASLGINKMMGVRKSTKLVKQPSCAPDDVHKKIEMFPYEEFMKIFDCEVISLSPRGLLNCGNSCYANAVLQCLTCTKPLLIFLLRRSHSQNCLRKEWCLVCELEQHAMMLRECGGPLSPSRILLHMQNSNCQIGDGSQEDAHEFLRLFVASLQSICLEGLVGENKVDLRLQETTFVQHTFGGRLRSKVKCMRCHHESERYENIMDLTLEIFGLVESLEDALTQFTRAEELDGENMYRCGRCSAYVRARKQLSIHEAPNILTIVLKRFQEGKYGKINKCISFPENLDMVPFMTGTGDVPPPYMLYGVVVHLDTLNASFSGHYVAYVKDLQGSWFRIDDSEVYPVPVNHVMSEGAYILFYKRSSPRPPGTFCEKVSCQQLQLFARNFSSRTQKLSGQGQTKYHSHHVGPQQMVNLKPQNRTGMTSHSHDFSRAASRNTVEMEFSDATSDWSLFTSSDEASFTTESTRDSFSTLDYSDTLYSNNLYTPESLSPDAVCLRNFSNSRPETKFFLEERGYVFDSSLSKQCQNNIWCRKVTNSLSEYPCQTYGSVKCGSNVACNLDRRSSHCKLIP